VKHISPTLSVAVTAETGASFPSLEGIKGIHCTGSVHSPLASCPPVVGSGEPQLGGGHHTRGSFTRRNTTVRELHGHVRSKWRAVQPPRPCWLCMAMCHCYSEIRVACLNHTTLHRQLTPYYANIGSVSRTSSPLRLRQPPLTPLPLGIVFRPPETAHISF
jgi:hypothetical protein